MNSEWLLPAVTKVSSRVWRILGQNPGPMTLGGTNTYLVGTGASRCLIDTGDADVPEYGVQLRKALNAAEAEISKPVSIATILLTHWHHDHVGGIDTVLDMFPDAVLYKMPSQCGDVDCSITERSKRTPPPILLNPFESLAVDDKTGRRILSVDADTAMEFIATPGHTDDHVALRLREENAIFTGDCILGGGSSVFACYSEFMASLELLRSLQPAVLYPGHGPVVADAIKRIDEQLQHRMKREQQLVRTLSELEQQRSGEGVTISDLVRVVYAETPAHLHPAAAVNVLHHLRKLLKDGVVNVAGGDVNSVKVFECMGDYDGGEGAALDAQKVTSVVVGVEWKLR